MAPLILEPKNYSDFLNSLRTPQETSPQVWVLSPAFEWAPESVLTACLSTTEVDYWKQALSEKRRQEFLRSRAALRSILGARLHLPPNSVPISSDSTKKPHLTDRTLALEFNVTHSGGWIAIATSNQGGIGIDLEHIRPLPNLESLLERFFHPFETLWVRAATQENDRLRRFFTVWTAKEASIKARGQKISDALTHHNCMPLIRGEVGATSDRYFALLETSRDVVGALVCTPAFASGQSTR